MAKFQQIKYDNWILAHTKKEKYVCKGRVVELPLEVGLAHPKFFKLIEEKRVPKKVEVKKEVEELKPILEEKKAEKEEKQEVVLAENKIVIDEDKTVVVDKPKKSYKVKKAKIVTE